MQFLRPATKNATERRKQHISHGARMIPPCDSTALMTQATRMLACGGAWGSKDSHFRRKWWDHSLATGQPLRRSAPASATSIVALGLTAHCSFRLIPPLRCIPHSGRSAPSPLIRGAFCRLPHGHTIPIDKTSNFPHCGVQGNHSPAGGGGGKAPSPLFGVWG